MFAALIVGDGRVAGAGAAGAERDRQRHPQGDLAHARLVVVGVRGQRAARVGRRRTSRPTSTGWVGQRALQDLRLQIFTPPAGDAGRLLRAPAGGRADLADDQRRRGARLAGHRRVVTLFQASLTLIGSIVILLLFDVKLALITFLIFPIMAVGLARVPDRVGRRVPAHARDDRRDHRLPAGVAVGHPRRALVRPGAAPPRAFAELNDANRDANMVDGQPQRRVLPGGRVASSRWRPSCPRLRRRPGDQRQRHGRRARRLHRGAERLLRPDRAAVAALHDLPVGHGRARQDLRAARRGARPRRAPDAVELPPQLRGEIGSTT